MTSWTRRALAVVGALAGSAAVTAAIAEHRWDGDTDDLVARLAERTRDPDPPVYSPGELRDLPAPVARYFAFALRAGQPMVRSARIEHHGEFRGGLDKGWSPFRSVQHFAADRPGFVWDARIRMAPGVAVHVRDSYVAGEGGMLARIGGAITVVDERATPALNSGALHRYFMERAWLPTSLLPSQGVRWSPIDDHAARATIRDGDVEVTADFFFAPSGEIERVAALRMRSVDGVGIPTPFEGRFGDYTRMDGMMIPRTGEVAWILPEGRLDYWRGTVMTAEFRYARPSPRGE